MVTLLGEYFDKLLKKMDNAFCETKKEVRDVTMGWEKFFGKHMNGFLLLPLTEDGDKTWMSIPQMSFHSTRLTMLINSVMISGQREE